MSEREREFERNIDYYQRAENEHQTVLAAMGVASLVCEGDDGGEDYGEGEGEGGHPNPKP